MESGWANQIKAGLVRRALALENKPTALWRNHHLFVFTFPNDFIGLVTFWNARSAVPLLLRAQIRPSKYWKDNHSSSFPPLPNRYCITTYTSYKRPDLDDRNAWTWLPDLASPLPRNYLFKHTMDFDHSCLSCHKLSFEWLQDPMSSLCSVSLYSFLHSCPPFGCDEGILDHESVSQSKWSTR